MESVWHQWGQTSGIQTLRQSCYPALAPEFVQDVR